MQRPEFGMPEPGAGVPVRVFTLGRFRVEVNGQPLRFEGRGQRKPLDLLKALIALGGENVAAERLAEALWPDADGDAAQRSFTTTLHRLRALIGTDALTLRGGMLTLEPSACWVDVRAFEAAAQAAGAALTDGDPDAAVRAMDAVYEHYGGPFLEGEFEPAEIMGARERLHLAFLRSVEAWAEACAGDGDPGRAAAMYKRGLEVDPAAEEFHRGLMRGCLESGRVAEGLAAYRQCRTVLQSTYGAQPSPETERLHAALLERNGGAEAAGPPTRAGHAAAGREQRMPARRRHLLWLAAAVVVLAVGSTAAWQRYRVWSRTAPSDARQPTIAVLAFQNLGPGPGHELLGESLSENLITVLANLTQVVVIARNSSFQFRERPVDVRKVGRELGVGYVLEGSVQEDGGRLRVNAQLVDAAAGTHLWAERYDVRVDDVFSVQDRLVRRIVDSLEVKLTEGEHSRLRSGQTASFAAWMHEKRCYRLMKRTAAKANAEAQSECERALALDPGYGPARLSLGFVLAEQGRFRWGDDPQGSLRRALAIAEENLAADPQDSRAHRLNGWVHMIRHEQEEAIAAMRRSVELTPNVMDASILLGIALVYAGEPEEALGYLNRAKRLSPLYDAIPPFNVALAKYLLGQPDAAAEAMRDAKARARKPDNPRADLFIVAFLVAAGRMDEAREAAADYRARFPGQSPVSEHINPRNRPFKDPSIVPRLVADLAKVGIE